MNKNVNFAEKHVNFAVYVFYLDINGKISIVSVVTKAIKINKNPQKPTKN